MSAVTIGFGSFAMPAKGVVVALCDGKLRFGPHTKKLLAPVADLIRRAADVDRFKGKSGSALVLIAPAGLKIDRLVVLGIEAGPDEKGQDWAKLGGTLAGRIPGQGEVTILAEQPGGPTDAQAAADLALGLMLRSYAFDRYKTKKKDDDEQRGDLKVTLGVADASGARKAWAAREPIGEGALMARDFVNEPPNVLYPEEFAHRAAQLKKVGVKIDILDEKQMTKLGMGALLGVGQGSDRESRIVIMRWDGGKRDAQPVAFVGKGVCFDTGGISIKPANNMEEMKGDMAGAACVVGLMHALAKRKAKVNVVGAIGLVENMPDGNAQRPGDIVTSMSGQTIEIINTDAEGRLVLADVLWYVATKFKPKFMVDLATLTGAIIVSLGHEYAGLFSNNDELAKRLIAAGESTGERVWRMPLGSEYDKQIDSKFADVKNTGGRMGGAITAAQFLQRFVDKTPWAHLDIAGTGMGAPSNDLNKSFGSGFGVRLLDRLVADHYEK